MISISTVSALTLCILKPWQQCRVSFNAPFCEPCDVDKFGRYQVNQTDNATESNQPAINLLHATAKTFARRNAGVAFGNRSIHTAEVFLPFSSAV